MALTIDQAIDNGDNSITITGHDDRGSYTTTNGRMSDLPATQTDQMTYYTTVLQASIPPEVVVLYQNPDYTPPVDGGMQ